jgi:hypothetical protein
MGDFGAAMLWMPAQPAYWIFVAFTGDMINSVNLDMWKRKECPIIPTNIQAALQFWDAANLRDLLPNSLFLAQNASIKGNIRQQRHPTFRDMLSIFFPEPDAPLHPRSVWHMYAQKGYLKELHDVERGLLDDAEGDEEEGADHVRDLRRSLGDMLASIQCLPVATLGSAEKLGSLWVGKGGQIHLLTNSIYYRLKSIGTGPVTKRAKIPQPRASQAYIDERLSEVHGGVPANVTRKKKYALSRMSNKRKNHRSFPHRKRATEQSTEQPTGEEEADDGLSAGSMATQTQTLAAPRRSQRSTAGKVLVVASKAQGPTAVEETGVLKKTGVSNASLRQTRSGEHERQPCLTAIYLTRISLSSK